MISSKDILAILVTKLRKELKDTHIECRDVKEGYRRGSIHIYFENLKANHHIRFTDEMKEILKSEIAKLDIE